MPNPGRALAAFSAAASVLVLAAVLSAQQPTKGKEEKKPDRAQQAEIAVLIKAVDQVAAGQPAPDDIPFAFHNHYMKARDTRTYVPFILTIDPTKVTTPALAIYLRVVKKGAAPEAPPPAAAKPGTKKGAGPEYAFEDIYWVDLPKAEAGQPSRVERAFSVPGGDYDVYLALKERAPQSRDKTAAPPKMSVMTQALTVPDYWNGQLATSSIILADKVDQVATAYSDAQQVEHPYTFGSTQIVPSLDNKFTKKGSLSIIFLVYNAADGGQVWVNKDTKVYHRAGDPFYGKTVNGQFMSEEEAQKAGYRAAQNTPSQTAAGGKPDVTIDYNFYVKNPDGTEKFFNKTNPQAFNAGTLPPQFDQSAGHQLVGGQEVPLASFPEGTYRLEIKVTDKLANKNLTENVTFTVTAG
jgi:hypothetical protein